MAQDPMTKDERDATVLEMFDPPPAAAPATSKPSAKKWAVVSQTPDASTPAAPADKKWNVVSQTPDNPDPGLTPSGIVDRVKKYVDPIAKMIPGPLSSNPLDLVRGITGQSSLQQPIIQPSGVIRGLMQSGIGVNQLLSQLGVGVVSKEALAAEQKKLEDQAKGSGTAGFVSEMVGNPLSYIPGGELAPVVRRAAQFGIMGLLSPTSDPTQTIVGRAGRAATGAAGGVALGKAAPYIVEAAGAPIATGGKVIDAAQKAAGKVLGPIVQPAARGALLSDNQVFGGGLNKALTSSTAEEGARLGKKLGVNFSAGELTGNAAARGAEDALANSARHATAFAEANQGKTNKIIENFNKTLNEVSPEGTSRTGIGEKVTNAYRSTIEALRSARSAQAKMDFEVADQAAGGKPTIEPSNFIGVLKKFVAEGSSDIATPAQKEAAGQAEKMLKGLTEPPPKVSTILDANGRPIQSAPAPGYKKITINDLQNGLATYGEGAKSPSGGIWKSLATASDRRFSQEAKSALDADLDAAASSGQGAEGQALKIARDNYRQASAKISDIQKTTLGKMIGSAEKDSAGNVVISPEGLADKFTAMEPTEIKNTLKFLDEHHPDVAASVRRYTLEKAFKDALEGSGQRGAGTTNAFAKAQFVKNLPYNDKLTAIFGNSKTAGDVRDIAAAMDRMIDYGAGKKGPDTASRLSWQGLKNWGAGTLYRSVISDTLAQDLLDPTKLRAMAKEADAINNPPAIKNPWEKKPFDDLLNK